MHGFGLYYVLFAFFLWHTLHCFGLVGRDTVLGSMFCLSFLRLSVFGPALTSISWEEKGKKRRLSETRHLCIHP
jgi:hypothetical protein